MKNTTCQPAAGIIERLGLSQNEIARRLGISPSTVNRWKLDAAHNGCDGQIPRIYWKRLRKIARDEGKRISVEFFVGKDITEDAAR